MEKKRKQLCFDINPETHKQIKGLALELGMSVSLWMALAIKDRLNKDVREYSKKNNKEQQ